MDFMKNLDETIKEEFDVSVTENGAIGYRTTGKKLLDINFSVTSLRNVGEMQIVDKFVKAFYEDKLLAVKWLFYVRDVREGVGERRLFRVCMKYLATMHKKIAKAVLILIPEYGRFDDWLCLLDTDLEGDIVELIKLQLEEDKKNRIEGKPISLLAKWLPSVNTSSVHTKKMAKFLSKSLGMREREYRKMLSELRAYIDVVEVKMSNKKWGEINYSAVPSRANLIYYSAFLRNDKERRQEFLKSVKKGEVKINSGVLFPPDIVEKYYSYNCDKWGSMRAGLKEEDDDTLEALWKALPDFVQGNDSTLCVVDGSGSMTIPVGHTMVTALDVANALGIYFSERCFGEFKNKFITFSENPTLIDLGKAESLREKLEISERYFEVANTNIEKVFDLILETAIKHGMSQEDIPKNILILSDMEFDECVECGKEHTVMPNETLFKIFAKRYKKKGYKLPRLVFWNICSRTGTIPVKENDLGVALVSGFSPVIAKIVLSNKIDPYECLLEQLNTPRYDAVEKALVDVLH